MRTPTLVKAASALVVCGLLALVWQFQIATLVRSHASPDGGAVAVTDVTFEDDGKHYVVHAHVTNTTAASVHVYSRERHQDFDEASRTLTVAMHSVPHPPPPNIKMLSCHVMLPSMIEIGPSASADLVVKVPRTQRKIGDAGWSEVPYAPARVRVELGWSDALIRLTGADQNLCTDDAEARFQQLERGVVTQTSR